MYILLVEQSELDRKLPYDSVRPNKDWDCVTYVHVEPGHIRRELKEIV